MLNVTHKPFMLSVVMVNAVMLSVVAPFGTLLSGHFGGIPKTSYEDLTNVLSAGIAKLQNANLRNVMFVRCE
jgi:hypothetical protein